ncbi:MAG: type II toxin-antitoxin system HicB family antitoxin [Armatimonadetes bacterium]|nr:type II toxin-antitoxin system HicB family antitoxin [Anaerolineae bacterium]
MINYHINIFYSPDDEAYIADLPDFEMCSAYGQTPQAALEQVLIARDALLLAMQERGLTPPQPKYQPEMG